MTNAAAPAHRVLFVIDNDFGALGTVMYLVHRQPFASRSTLLLPRRAHELHAGSLPVASRPYEGLQDILDAVEAESPDVVCLFSGYLIAAQRLVSLRDLRKLVERLRQRGCKVATSDPYVGAFDRLPEADLPASSAGWRTGRLARLLRRKLVERHVRRVEAILEGVTRIYPVPVDLPQDGPRISFFNPLYIRGEGELQASPDRWLFVIAQFDLELQEREHGTQGFADKVAAKFREAVEAGKLPTFIGPASITAELSRRFADDARVSFLPTCSFGEFEARLLEAGIVFYWNIFSTSAFFRLWNGLPVFYFDPGHNSRLLPPMREAGLKYYFMDSPPIQLDIGTPLDAAGLAARSEGFRRAARQIRERLAPLPTSAEMIRAIAESG